MDETGWKTFHIRNGNDSQPVGIRLRIHCVLYAALDHILAASTQSFQADRALGSMLRRFGSGDGSDPEVVPRLLVDSRSGIHQHKDVANAT